VVTNIKTPYGTIQYDIVLGDSTGVLTPVDDRIRILEMNLPNFMELQEDYIPKPEKIIIVDLKKYYVHFKAGYDRIRMLEQCVKFLIDKFVKEVRK
jgi:hypothetical protein